MKQIRKVDNLIAKQLRKNHDKISNALIEPMHPDYPYSTNGIYFFCARMGGGKTYTVLRHIMVTETLFDQPYYDSIIFTSTSGSMDKTVQTLKKSISTPITYVPETKLVSYLERHLRGKMKYYAVMEFLNSGGSEVSDLMKHILEKHRLWKMMRGRKVYDLKRIVMYAQAIADKYSFSTYPSNTLLVCDDFATSPLLKKIDSPLIGILTKTRHYNLTAIIVAQTWRFIHLNLKRLCTDIVIWSGYSIEDFQKMISQCPTSLLWKDLWPIYSRLPNKHSKLIIHTPCDQYEIA